jgi:hypothetical protein
MPVYKILDEMPYEELQCWFSYLDRRPVDWRDDDRTFKFLQTQGYKGKPWEVFVSLSSIYKPAQSKKDDKHLDIENLKNSLFFQKMLSARKGDLIDFNEIEGDKGASGEP